MTQYDDPAALIRDAQEKLAKAEREARLAASERERLQAEERAEANRREIARLEEWVRNKRAW